MKNKFCWIGGLSSCVGLGMLALISIKLALIILAVGFLTFGIFSILYCLGVMND